MDKVNRRNFKMLFRASIKIPTPAKTLKELLEDINEVFQYKDSEDITELLKDIEHFRNDYNITSNKIKDFLDSLEINLLGFRRRNDGLDGRALMLEKVKDTLKEQNLDLKKLDIISIL